MVYIGDVLDGAVKEPEIVWVGAKMIEKPKEKIKKATIRERINNWFGYWLYKRMGVRAGPFMFHSRGEWWFVDHIGNVYIIQYDDMGAYRGNPIRVMLFHKV